MDDRPIGIFDSGVGGLSVLRELYKRLPGEDYIFFADQHNVPYGEKTPEELIMLTSRIMKFLMSHNVKMAVVACNTATCYAIDALRAEFNIPIVGVVPAIKLAVEQTKTGNIALIATPATAKSAYVTGLIEKFAGNCNVLRVGCFGLENAVETGSLESEETARVLAEYVAPLKKENIDQLVLGCTHYPFLKRQIADILGPGVDLIDSGEAVARRVEMLLDQENLKSAKGASATQFFTNKDASDFSRVAGVLLGKEVEGRYVSI